MPPAPSPPICKRPLTYNPFKIPLIISFSVTKKTCAVVCVPHKQPSTEALTIPDISLQFAAINIKNFFPTTFFKPINLSQPAFHPIYRTHIVGILSKMILFRVVPCAFFRTFIARHSPTLLRWGGRRRINE